MVPGRAPHRLGGELDDPGVAEVKLEVEAIVVLPHTARHRRHLRTRQADRALHTARTGMDRQREHRCQSRGGNGRSSSVHALAQHKGAGGSTTLSHHRRAIMVQWLLMVPSKPPATYLGELLLGRHHVQQLGLVVRRHLRARHAPKGGRCQRCRS
jgi:hypothetical protein